MTNLGTSTERGRCSRRAGALSASAPSRQAFSCGALCSAAAVVGVLVLCLLARVQADARDRVESSAVSVGARSGAGRLLSQAPADKNASGATSATRKRTEKEADSKGVAGKGGTRSLPGITPAREAAVMTFVKHHHAELAELLVHLKESAPKEYDRAVRDLFRTSERLAQLQERDSQGYELELNLWKARSRAQLIAARLQMSDTPELREQLRSTLNEEYDIRVELVRRDRDRVADRLKNLEEQLERLSQRRGDEIERQIRQLTQAGRGGADAKSKSSSKKKSESKPKTK